MIDENKGKTRTILVGAVPYRPRAIAPGVCVIMCGIAGAFDLTGKRDFSTDRLLAMTGAIAHRGPDDEQVHQEPGVALGARRLSIVDLAGGRQPLSNEDGSV